MADSGSISQFVMDWTIAAHTGWGIYGVNLALQAVRRGILMVPVTPGQWRTLHPLHRAALSRSEAAEGQLIKTIIDSGQKQFRVDCPFLHSVSGAFVGTPLSFELNASRHVCLYVSETSHLGPKMIERGRKFDWIVTCSRWNQKTLQNHGFTNVSLMHQGFDPSLFQPGPRNGMMSHFFTIFSGGKLEYRKGQDIVIAAVREFQKRHADALLVFAWDNAWPETTVEIATSGLVSEAPRYGEDGRIMFAPWLKEQGVTNFVNLGMLHNWQMPLVLREMDVAVLPSRGEGATNFVAMETIASGVPTILSANTGHLDLIPDEGSYPLLRQGPVKPTKDHKHVGDWGESSVEEIVEHLERIYAERAESRRWALRGAEAIEWMTWEKQFPKLLEKLGSP